MADYVEKDIYEWSYCFSSMTATIAAQRVQLAVRDGILGWLDSHGYWVRLYGDDVQQAYLKWLDKQIYGDANG